ncbi:MAG TPA: hypothetical protein VFX37_10620 [Pseudolabrys sp.]|nr:hypothetical protein [Pseudolabrys sp.]
MSPYNNESDAFSLADKIASRERKEVECPPAWTPEWVDYRLTEAYEVLMSLPGQTRPRQFGNSMPRPVYSADDTDGWFTDDDRARNQLSRYRGAASLSDITRMEEALAWPLRYLGTETHLARAVAWSAFRKAVKREDGKLHQKFFVSRRTFFRWRLKGLNVICHGLILHRVVVS